MVRLIKILFYLLQFSTLFGRFGYIEVDVDLTQIRDSDKQFLKSLPDDIKSYYENVIYDSDSEDLELEIYLKLILENIPRNGNERTISSQFIFTNNFDLTLYSKSSSFNYSSGVDLSYNSSFHSLRSILDFYGLLFVGSEIDILSDLGGEIYFSRAQEIAYQGEDSRFSDGWNSRRDYVENIIDFKEFRNSKFKFFQALDMIYSTDKDENKINLKLTEFFESILQIPDYMFESKYVKNFFKVYSVEIAKYLHEYNLTNELNQLQLIDPDNEEVYKKYFND